MKTSSVDIVIVNWNSGEALAKCVRSIEKIDRSGFELQTVIIVDNASTDESLSGVASATIPLHIVRNGGNRGFAAACNQGAAAGTATHIFLLNNDAALSEGALTLMVEFMESHPEVAIAGPRLESDSGAIAPSCARFPTARALMAHSVGLDRVMPAIFRPHFLTLEEQAAQRFVDQVMGAAFLVRRDVWQDLGGFDERFFVYFEELDFSLRASQHGWRTAYVPEARVVHTGGWTTGRARPRRLALNLESRLKYARKHFGTVSGAAVAVLTLAVEPLLRLAIALGRFSGQAVADTMMAYFILWGRVLRAGKRSS